MCDFAPVKRSACQKSSGKWLEPVKRSRWELPCPNSKSYWKEMIRELEEKFKRVRAPHPPSLPSPNLPTNSVRTSFTNNFKSKVSPPSLMHKTQQIPVQSSEVDLLNHLQITINEHEINKQSHNVHEKLIFPAENLKIYSSDVQNQERKNIKIFSKQSCPYHKNTEPVKIFDDEISNYLPPITHGKKSNIIKESYQTPVTFTEIKLTHTEGNNSKNHKQRICTHRHSFQKPSSASSLSSKVEQRFTEKKNTESRQKAPKLCMANLVPSFAKPVSTDSSISACESLDSEIEHNTETNTDMASATKKKDYLRVPKLSFITAPPISHNFSPDYSCQKEDNKDRDSPIVVDEKKSTPPVKRLESNKKVLASQIISIKKKQDSGNIKNDKSFEITRYEDKIMPLTFSDLEKKYAFKALDLITKYKRVTFKSETHIPLKKQSLLSKEPKKPLSSEFSKSRSEFGQIKEKDQIDTKDTQWKLRKFTSKHCHQFNNSKSHKAESITLYSSSRSTSGTSQDFDTNTLLVPSADVLGNIPQTKVFQRAYIDKCHACLHKPFKSSQKVFRELPLAMLLSIMNNPPRFKTVSASNSSSFEDFEDYSSHDSTDQSLFDDLKHDTCLPEINIEDQHLKDTESKLQIKLTFDDSTLTTKDSLLVPSPKDKSFSTISITEQPADRSLSVQSSEHSKTSTQNNQSSDSDDSRPMEDKVLPSKYKAPCHAPTVFRQSLEPFRALRLKKATSLRARAAALTAKSSDGSDSDETNNLPKKPDKSATSESAKEIEGCNEKKKNKKLLTRLKTIASEMMVGNLSTSGDNIQERTSEKIKVLKRAKTAFDLMEMRENSASEESDMEKDQTAIPKEQINEITEQKEHFPYSDIILMHRARSPPPAIMTNQDVIETIKACLQRGLGNPANLMERLSEEFINKIEERYKFVDDKEVSKYLELGLKLFKALANSRRYLKPKIYCPDLELSQSQPLSSNKLQEEVPSKIYELVAPILKMPHRAEKSERSAHLRYAMQSDSDYENASKLSSDMQVHPSTEQDSLKFDLKSGRRNNPYASFLKKPRRKAVVWRELREDDMRGYDPEATLEMRAARLMDRICRDFCQWLERLGGNDQVIDEDTLKDMFEINFTAEACKAMQVVLKEMPTVPIQLASVRKCLEKSELEATRRQIRRDKLLEHKSKRTIAFGRCLPSGLRFVPPRHPLSAKWTHCEYIPKDVEAMDDIWSDIMHLDSVCAFMDYLKDNSQGTPTKLLLNLQNRRNYTSALPAEQAKKMNIAGEVFMNAQARESVSLKPDQFG